MPLPRAADGAIARVREARATEQRLRDTTTPPKRRSSGVSAQRDERPSVLGCWGCAVGIASTGEASGTMRRALGVCVNCGVLGCSGDAERDRVSHQWTCTASVVAAVSIGAGIDDSTVIPREGIVRSVEEFERRYPVLAWAAAAERARVDLGMAGMLLVREAHFRESDLELSALAVALGLYLVRDLQVDGVAAPQEPFTAVMLPRLATVVRAATR